VRLPDANVLLYAVNEDAGSHGPARDWLLDSLSGSEPVGFAWSALLAFVRISTKESIFPRPLTASVALDLVEGWLERPQTTVLAPGERHGTVLRELIEGAGTAGDLTSDAHLAAIAIEHGAVLATFDTDFFRFRGLRVDYLG
jgi:toxin-antitoxin system PIN domain toxin